MSHEGHAGFTLQVVPDKTVKAGYSVLIWSPSAYVSTLGRLEAAGVRMLEDATEDKDVWLYWYDHHPDESNLTK